MRLTEQRDGDTFRRERVALEDANYTSLKNNKLCLVNGILITDI